MTKQLRETLGLPSLEEILAQNDIPNDELPDAHDVDETFLTNVENLNNSLITAGSADHETSMDTVFKETLQHARDIADLGHNVDHSKAGRMFEVAATMYKVAIDSKNSKRDMQLKMIKLAQEQEKLELAKKVAEGTVKTSSTIEGNITSQEGTIRADRNDILAQYRNKPKDD